MPKLGTSLDEYKRELRESIIDVNFKVNLLSRKENVVSRMSVAIVLRASGVQEEANRAPRIQCNKTNALDRRAT
jgi:hypothetical protein